MRQRVDANDTIALVPGIAPVVQPLAYARSETGPRSTARGVLCPCVLLLADNQEDEAEEVFFLELQATMSVK